MPIDSDVPPLTIMTPPSNKNPETTPLIRCSHAPTATSTEPTPFGIYADILRFSEYAHCTLSCTHCIRESTATSLPTTVLSPSIAL